jgi:tetratricopeptide (TPR) repeat protein
VVLTAIAFLILGIGGAVAFHFRARQTEAESDGAVAHWQEAQQAIAAQDYPRARTNLEECLKVCPLDAEAHFLLARVCRLTDDRAGWESHLSRAALLQWPRDETQFETALMQAQSGEVRGVLSQLLEYLDSRPGEEVLIVEALIRGYLESFSLGEVYSWTEQWTEHHPQDARPWVYRGRAYYLGRSPSKAVAAYEQALALAPDLAEAHLQLAGVLMVQSHFDQALPHYLAGLQGRPGEAKALVGLANCYFALGQMDRARDTLNLLLAGSRPDAGAYFILAKVALAEGKMEEALRQLRAAETLAPQETDILYALSTVLAKLGKANEARQYEQKLKDLTEQVHRLEDLRRQINREPANVALRHEAGSIALRMGQEQEAIRWLQSALQIDPKYAPTLQLLAQHYQKTQARH